MEDYQQDSEVDSEMWEPDGNYELDLTGVTDTQILWGNTNTHKVMNKPLEPEKAVYCKM